MDDANRPTKLVPLNPRGGRDLDTGATGNIAQDGYRLVARRPRSQFTDEIMEPAQADAIESFERGMRPYGSDLDYDD